MKLCVQTAPLLGKYSVDETFRIIHEAGFEGADFNIDIFLPYADIVNGRESKVFSLGEEDLLAFAKEYKDASEKYGVAISQMHAPFPSYVKSEAGNAIVMDAIKKCIMISGYLGCKKLIVHPMYFSYDEQMDPQTEWDVNIERYTELIPLARKHDVIICLENTFTAYRGKMYASCCADMAEANRYVNYLNSIAGEKLFGFCLDVGHALLVGKEIYSTIMELGDNLTTLHVHDNDGLNDKHLFPYMGVMDWNRFCKGLKDVGYKGDMCFETFNALNVIDSELDNEALKFLSAIGRMFIRRIEG